ncbi:MAG: TspO protein [Rhodospirillales bacterium 69-11]|nr:MAG: TspO protein [Rhodospirillales bacterium 69-11]
MVGFVGLCLLVGATAGAVTAPAVATWYQALVHPPGTPPDWVFAPVWTTLYVLMGVAGWLVWRRIGPARPLRLWGWQLAANAAWSPAFFGLHNPPLGMAILLVLVVLVGLTLRAFWRVRPVAGWLMVPYLAWVCYAGYLNAGVWWLNGASP